MKTELLIKNNVFPIPVGDFFHKETDACYLVYAPLSNVFYLSTGDEVRKLEQTLEKRRRYTACPETLEAGRV